MLCIVMDYCDGGMSYADNAVDVSVMQVLLLLSFI